MSLSLKHRARLFVGSALSILLLGWILSLGDLDGVLRVAQGVPAWAILATLGIIYTSIPIRVIQWHLLLGARARPPFRSLFRAVSLGYLGNLLLPMAGGEVLKSFLLARTSELSFPHILGSIVLVRVQDVLLVLALAALATFVLPFVVDVHTGVESVLPGEWTLSENGIGWALGATVFGCLLVIGALAGLFTFREHARQHIVAFLTHVSRPLADYADSLMEQFVAGLNALGNPRRFVAALGLAGLCWAVFALAPLPLLLSFSFGLRQACITALVVTGLATLAQLVPIAPAGLGTYHALCIVALSVVNPNADRDVMIAYALISHFIGTVGPALVGLAFLPESLAHVRLARDTVRSGDVPCMSEGRANAPE